MHITDTLEYSVTVSSKGLSVALMSSLTHNGVFGACLLATLHIQLLPLSNGVGVCESKAIHLGLRVLPVHIDGDLSLAKNMEVINGGYI